MRTSARVLLACAAFVGMVPVAADAHFQLLAPASWLVENQLGDPQKAAPCGLTDAAPGKPSGVNLQITADPSKPIDTRWGSSSSSR